MKIWLTRWFLHFVTGLFGTVSAAISCFLIYLVVFGNGEIGLAASSFVLWCIPFVLFCAPFISITMDRLFGEDYFSWIVAGGLGIPALCFVVIVILRPFGATPYMDYLIEVTFNTSSIYALILVNLVMVVPGCIIGMVVTAYAHRRLKLWLGSALSKAEPLDKN